ncbi:MAG: AbrB/MazE/SpoVT family DNA-binding domain-containing protein [Proteobacteria bacterium]|nr:AbrB/MazE/SpoVT family DNA-binding domain-containing protein [Pseudomonadota bacterium]
MPHTSTLTKLGTTTVPRSIREALDMRPGDRLEWQVTRDGAVLCRHKPRDPQRATVSVVSPILGRQ